MSVLIDKGETIYGVGRLCGDMDRLTGTDIEVEFGDEQKFTTSLEAIREAVRLVKVLSGLKGL